LTEEEQQLKKTYRLSASLCEKLDRYFKANPLKTDSENIEDLLELGLEPPESEGEIVERWLCPFCQNPFSVENRLRLLSHFKNTHLLEFEENPALMKLRKIFQVAINTGKIKECEFLDLSKYPAECLKDFPDRTYKIDGMLKCKACQTRQRQVLERRTGIPLAPVQQPICDCHFIEGTYYCSKFHKICDHPNCLHYVKKETEQ